MPYLFTYTVLCRKSSNIIWNWISFSFSWVDFLSFSSQAQVPLSSSVPAAVRLSSSVFGGGVGATAFLSGNVKAEENMPVLTSCMF